MSKYKRSVVVVSGLISVLFSSFPPSAGQLDTRTFTSCRTSKTDQGEGDRGQLDQPCVFPFTLRNRTYWACTYDYSHITVYKPWCSTKTDKLGNHISGGKNWGVCDDLYNCPIPPRHCGEPVRTRRLPDDRDDNVDIIQMPWMVSLGKFDEKVWGHQCGGSLVTAFHVLTAAHCFDLLVDLEGYKMRLGSADMEDPDEGIIERNVARIMVHPKYVQRRAYFDVGIALADRQIEFTEYVRPVCLPMTPVDDENYLSGDFVTLAGWGLQFQTATRLYAPTKSLKLHTLQVNSKEICESIFSREYLKELKIPLFKLGQLPYGFQSDISCVGNEWLPAEGACDGDSGSPVILRISGTARGKPYFEQHYIVSTGVDCELKATIYTRVTNREILHWIQKTTDTFPLLMVVGGYNSERQLMNDVELLSSTPNNVCSKHVRPIFGKAYQSSDGTIENEAEMLGHVGVFAKDAPRVCGGKNAFDNLDTCYEFNNTANRWYPMPSMIQKRYQGAAVLDDKGNMWVMGGTHNSKAADSTEIFEYQPPPRVGRWRKGRPLPADLRDSGIDSHCAVRLNNSHIFIAGGFARAFRLRDSTLDNNSNRDSTDDIGEVNIGELGTNPRLATLDKRQTDDDGLGPIGGGYALKRAWLFDGYYWTEIADMHTVRDRPACSVLEMPDGTVRVLVAGGCKGWCANNPAMSGAEMYNPETNLWQKVADLPTPLSSARMDLLDGIPTIIGGYDNRNQNGLLYQYMINEDVWTPHPSVRLRVPRSSPAVFQVPKSLFKYC